MPIEPRPYRGEPRDQRLIASLLADQPDNRRHIVDLPWRLSCPPTADGASAAIWQAGGGQPGRPDQPRRRAEPGAAIAFAAWQAPWAALDLFLPPGPDHAGLTEAVFTWADQLFRALDEARGHPLPYWIEYRDDDPDRLEMCRRYGFGLHERRYVQLSCELAGRADPGSRPAPAGFRIRPLAGEAEAGACAAAHRAAFGSEWMTAEWRVATLRSPQYVAELDLVAEAPDGTLAGFCVGWLDRDRRLAQIEPAGVRSEYQRRGLGAALVGTVLDRMADAGAELAIVDAEPDNTAAVATYESAGFRVSSYVDAAGKRLSD